MKRCPLLVGVTCLTIIGCAHVPPSTCAVPPPPRVQLAVGQSVLRTVNSRNERNHTGVMVDSGATYRFVAHGKWKDGRLDSTTAGGFSLRDVPLVTRWIMWSAQPIRRAPHARWFALVGEISSAPRQFFVIGDSLPRWDARRSGELVVFANDVKHAAKNNQGCISLSVERLR